MTAFTHYLKLQGILAFAIRTVYAINRSKAQLGYKGPEWETKTGKVCSIFRCTI